MQPARLKKLFPHPFSSSTNGCLPRRSYSRYSHSAPEQCLLHVSHSLLRLFKGVELTFRLFPIEQLRRWKLPSRFLQARLISSNLLPRPHTLFSLHKTQKRNTTSVQTLIWNITSETSSSFSIVNYLYLFSIYQQSIIFALPRRLELLN